MYGPAGNKGRKIKLEIGCAATKKMADDATYTLMVGLLIAFFIPMYGAAWLAAILSQFKHDEAADYESIHKAITKEAFIGDLTENRGQVRNSK